MPEMSQQRTIFFSQIEFIPHAFRLVGLFDVQGDRPLVMPGYHALIRRDIGQKIKSDSAPSALLRLGLDR